MKAAPVPGPGTLSEDSSAVLNNPERQKDPESPSVGVAMPAAGSGARMGGVRKPFLELSGEPVLLHSLRPFLAHPQVRAVAVALAEEEFLEPPAWLQALDPRVRLVRGGASRGESVMAALQVLPTWVEVVAVHDAARPLVTRRIIDRCLVHVTENQGVVAGWPAVDTLKRVDEEHRVAETLSRSEIWHAQTPQLFPRALLLRAYEDAARSGISDTDDAALVERVGGTVKMVPGRASNIKVTRPEDLPLAEYFLRQGED